MGSVQSVPVIDHGGDYGRCNAAVNYRARYPVGPCERQQSPATLSLHFHSGCQPAAICHILQYNLI